MQLIFTTTDVHPRDRIAYWHDVAGKIYVKHHSQIERVVDFDAQISIASLADITGTVLEIGPCHLTRTQADCDQSQDDHGFVCLQQVGNGWFEQDGRECITSPGDFLVLDARRPYGLRFAEKARLFILKSPQALISQRIGPWMGMTAVAIDGSSGLGGLASNFLASLPDCLPLESNSVAERIADHALDLVTVALSQAVSRERPALSSSRSVALANLLATIDHNLSSPNLTPTIVAGAAGLSVRYANLLLAEQGTSVERLILARRLEVCRRILADPAQAHRTITEIAYSWGFSDVSHFGRRFKELTGKTPREYRVEPLKATSAG